MRVRGVAAAGRTLALHCDDAHDCSPGYICCARLVVEVFSSVECDPACSGADTYRVCGDPDPNTCDSDAGEQCVPLQQVLGQPSDPDTTLRVCHVP